MSAFDPKRTLTALEVNSRVRIVGVGVEKLLVNLVVADRLLAFWRHQPVDKRLSILLLHVRMLVGVHQYDAVLVEHAFVALDHDLQIALVLSMTPRCRARGSGSPAASFRLPRS